jgi:hypothetical protein
MRPVDPNRQSGGIGAAGKQPGPARLAERGPSEGGHLSEQYTRQVNAGRASLPPNLLPRFG